MSQFCVFVLLGTRSDDQYQYHHKNDQHSLYYPELLYAEDKSSEDQIGDKKNYRCQSCYTCYELIELGMSYS